MRTAAALLLLAGLQDPPPPCPFAPREVAAARSRIDFQALWDGLVVNRGDDAPLEVRVTALDRDGKALADFPAQKFDSVRSGRAVRLKLSMKNQPDYAGYRLTCLSGSNRWTFLARAIQDEPALEAGTLAEEPKSDVSIAGIDVLFGKLANRSYSGDVLALRLRIPKPLDGKLTVKVAYEGKELGKLSPAIAKAAWKTDAKKLFEKESVPGVVAYDAAKDEIVVTLFNLKKETSVPKLTLDVSFESGKQKWSWDALTDPFLALK